MSAAKAVIDSKPYKKFRESIDSVLAFEYQQDPDSAPTAMVETARLLKETMSMDLE